MNTPAPLSTWAAPRQAPHASPWPRLALRLGISPASSLLGLLLLGGALAGCPTAARKTHVTACKVDNECSGGLCIQSQCEPGDGDRDGDGLSNRIEQRLGTDPARADTDGDGQDDRAEVGADLDHPLDSDGDGVIDALESSASDRDQDCLVDSEDPVETSLADRRAMARCPTEGLCAGAPEGTFTIACERTPQGDGGDAVVWSCAVASGGSALGGYEAQETLCDQQDNDCDGQTDEGPDGLPMTCCQGDTDCADLAVAPTCLDASQCEGVEIVATCDPQTRACVTETKPAPAACEGEGCAEATCASDGATFRAGGVCSDQGSCVTPDPTSCDDENPCTDDTCDPTGGCVHTAVVCDDENPCTDDTCDPTGGCVHTANPTSCDDENPCTDDTCDPTEGCVYTAVVCDEGPPCGEQGICEDGACVYPDPVCDDENPCTDDTCDPTAGCVHTPSPGSCDDGDPCTVGDTCTGGQCAGVASLGATVVATGDGGLGSLDAVHGLSPLTLPDGTPGYALAGEAWVVGGSGDVPEQGWVGVVDAQGQPRWGQGLGGPGDDALRAVAALPGGGFVAVGTYAAQSVPRDDLWVVGLAPTGDQTAPYAVTGQRLFDSGGDDDAFAVAALPDSLGGGFVVAGRAGSPGSGQTGTDGWLLRFEPGLGEVWHRTLGGPGDDELRAVAVGEDGLIYAAGTSSPSVGVAPSGSEAQDADAWLLVVDAQGEPVRERRWDVGGGWDDEALAVVPVSSITTDTARGEGVLLAGRTRDPSAAGASVPQRAWAVRLDAFGALAWEHLAPAPEGASATQDTAFYGAAADAGGFVLVGAHGGAAHAVALDALGNVRWTRSMPSVGPLTSLTARPAALGWVAGARAEVEALQLVRLDAWGHGTCQEAGLCVTRTVSDCPATEDNPCAIPGCDGPQGCVFAPGAPAAPCPGADACHPVGACDDTGQCVQAPRLFSWTGAAGVTASVTAVVPTRHGGYALFGALDDGAGAGTRAHGWYLGPDGALSGDNEPYVAPFGQTSRVTAAARLYDGRMVVVGEATDGTASWQAFARWLEPDGEPVAGLAQTEPGAGDVGAGWEDVAASEDGREVAAVGWESRPTPTPIFQSWDAHGNPILPAPVHVGAGQLGGGLDELTAIAPAGPGRWVAAGQVAFGQQSGGLSARVVWFDLQGQIPGDVTFQDPGAPDGISLSPRDLVALPDGRVVVAGERQPGAVDGPESFVAVVSGPGGEVSHLTVLGASDGSPALDAIVRGPLGLVALGRAVSGGDQVVAGFALEPNVAAGGSLVVRAWTWAPPGASFTIPQELAAAVLPGGDLLLGGSAGAPSLARLDPWGTGASCEAAQECGVMDVRVCDGPVDGDPCTTSYCDPGAGGCLGQVQTLQAVCVGSACTSAGACSDTGGCGAPVGCDDGDPCTLDACVEGSGCRHDPAPGWSSCCQAGLAQPDTAPDCDADGVADVCADAADHAQPVATGVWLRGDDLSQPFQDPAVEAALAFADPLTVTFVAHGEERGVELHMAEPFGDDTDTWGPSLPGGASFLSVSIYQAWPPPAGSPSAGDAGEPWASGMGERLELHYGPGNGVSGALQRWDGQAWAYQDATTHAEAAGNRVRVTGVGAGPGPCASFLVAVVVELMDQSGSFHKLVKVVARSDAGGLVTAYPYTQLIAP